MSLFPFIDGVAESDLIENNLPTFKEYLYDFDLKEFVLKEGKLVIVEENEALAIWVRKALSTERYRYLAYTWDYGHEINRLIGSGYSKEYTLSEVVRYIRECILINPYIKDIENVDIVLEGELLKVTFKLLTIYGEVSVDATI